MRMRYIPIVVQHVLQIVIIHLNLEPVPYNVFQDAFVNQDMYWMLKMEHVFLGVNVQDQNLTGTQRWIQP